MKTLLTVIFSLFISFSAFATNGEKQLAKDFTAPSLDGKTINLKEQRGKVVVLTFWSTTCLICTGELPKLSKVVNKYAGKDVVFIALSMENEAKISNYLKKKPFNSIIIPNALGIITDYSIHDANGNYNIGFPTFFVINQVGEIVMTASGRNKTNAIDSNISRLLMNRQ